MSEADKDIKKTTVQYGNFTQEKEKNCNSKYRCMNQAFSGIESTKDSGGGAIRQRNLHRLIWIKVYWQEKWLKEHASSNWPGAAVKSVLKVVDKYAITIC